MRKTIDIASLILLLGMSLAAAQEPTAPAGMRGSLSSFQRAFTLTWEQTGKQEVAGYNVYRRTRLDGAPVRINSDLVTIRTFADRVDGHIFYYSVRAVDAGGHESAESAILDSSVEGNLIFSAPNGGVTVAVPAAGAGVFPSFGNSLGVPLALQVRQSSPSSGGVVRDVSIVFVRADTGEEINEVGFGRAKVRVRIGYADAEFSSAQGVAAPRPSLYWYNGFSWIRTVGNAASGAVELETAQVGRFQLRADAAGNTANGAPKVYPTVITPNGDGLNDRAFVMLDGVASGEVFDRFGRRIAGLRETTVAGNPALSWDGRDDAGNPVGSDLYVIRVMGSDRPLMATVAVAR